MVTGSIMAANLSRRAVTPASARVRSPRPAIMPTSYGLHRSSPADSRRRHRRAARAQAQAPEERGHRAERHQPGVRRRGHRQDRRVRRLRHRRRTRRRGQGAHHQDQEDATRKPAPWRSSLRRRTASPIAAPPSAPAAAVCGRGSTTQCSSSTRPGRSASPWSTWAACAISNCFPSRAWPTPGATATGPTSPSARTRSGARSSASSCPGAGTRSCRSPSATSSTRASSGPGPSWRAWLREEGLPGWDPRRNEGFARHLLVRSAQKGAELLVSLVTVPGELPGAERLIERLRADLPQLVGFVHSINGGRAELSSGLGGHDALGQAVPAREGGRRHPEDVRERLLPDEQPARPRCCTGWPREK